MTNEVKQLQMDNNAQTRLAEDFRQQAAELNKQLDEVIVTPTGGLINACNTPVNCPSFQSTRSTLDELFKIRFE